MEKNSQTKSVFTISGRHRFVACVIVVILVSCAAFAYLASCYKQAQDDIVALQKKDALMFEQVLNSSKNVKSKSSENIDQLQTCLISIKSVKRLFSIWNTISYRRISMYLCLLRAA